MTGYVLVAGGTLYFAGWTTRPDLSGEPYVTRAWTYRMREALVAESSRRILRLAGERPVGEEWSACRVRCVRDAEGRLRVAPRGS